MSKRFNDELYYSPSKLLSYNKYLNFVVGNRGGGKSFAAKRWAINGWLKNRKQFVYVRRYKTEFDKIKTYFDDIKDFYPEHVFRVDKGCMYIDDEIAGYYIALSTSQKDKSSSYPDVDKIIFDEFIIDPKGVYHYVRGEVDLFLDLCETIGRDRDDMRVMLIANAITIVNPYFSYFNIKIKPNQKFTTVGECCVELYKKQSFIDMKRKTKFGKLIDNTRYGAYNIDNEFYADNYSFIEPMTGQCIPWCSFKYGGKIFNVWYSNETGYIYFNKTPVPNNRECFVITNNDHEPNYIMINTLTINDMNKR